MFHFRECVLTGRRLILDQFNGGNVAVYYGALLSTTPVAEDIDLQVIFVFIDNWYFEM